MQIRRTHTNMVRKSYETHTQLIGQSYENHTQTILKLFAQASFAQPILDSKRETQI